MWMEWSCSHALMYLFLCFREINGSCCVAYCMLLARRISNVNHTKIFTRLENGLPGDPVLKRGLP